MVCSWGLSRHGCRKVGEMVRVDEVDNGQVLRVVLEVGTGRGAAGCGEGSDVQQQEEERRPGCCVERVGLLRADAEGEEGRYTEELG